MIFVKKITIRFWSFISLAIAFCLHTSSPLHAAPTDDKKGNRPNFKALVNDFIKDVVSDIVAVSTPTTTSSPTFPTPPSASHPTTPAIAKSLSAPTTPNSAKTGTKLDASTKAASAPHNILVIDNILYIDNTPATLERVDALKAAGIVIDASLVRYIPIAKPQPTQAPLPIAAKVSTPTKILAKHLEPTENVAFSPDKSIEESVAAAKVANLSKPTSSSASASIEKVVLADIYDENIPCDYHYDHNWHNSNIHPYRYDLSKMPQTVVFLLTHGLGGDFADPVEGKSLVTSGFGPRGGRHHNGIDLDLETGDRVKSAFAGKVRIAQYSSSFGYVVVVRHFNGLETTYAHLSKIMVSPNQDVDAGTVVGLGGNTGRSRGSHLHFEVRYKGHPLNPREMIDFERNTLKSNTFTIDRSYFSSSNPYEDAHELGMIDNHDHDHEHSSKVVRTVSATKYHTVKKGDTISEIADHHNVSIQKICSLNKISVKTTLKPGRKLRVK